MEVDIRDFLPDLLP